MLIDKFAGCDGLGRGSVGYWGRDIHRRVLAESEHVRQRSLLTEQVMAGGFRMALWTSAKDGVRCGCYKLSHQQAERKCSSCHGVGYVPGYFKFGYNTIWMTGMDDDVVLDGMRITKDFKSSKMELLPDRISGYIESSDKSFVRSAIGSSWEYRSEHFLRDESGSDIKVEFSLDSGFSWNDISELPVINPSSGVIRFKVILTRDTLNVISPLFEILRARYATINLSNQQSDGSYRLGPWILVMKSIPNRQYIKSEKGDLPQEDVNKFWTMGLATFDPSIQIGSEEELLVGPGILMEVLDGALKGHRYVITSWQNSDPFAYIIVDQSFNARIEDNVGPYKLVW